MIDLFCGAGIGAIGFKRAGFIILDAIDNKEYAVRAYNQNIGHHARVRDIRKLNSDELQEVDLYTAGIPCIPFSVAGKREGVEDEEYGDLAYHYLRLVQDGQPKVFVLENVKGIINKRNIEFFEDLIMLFENSGYRVVWKLINTYLYGTPQKRERIFVVGIRNDLETIFEFPEPVSADKLKTVQDAIGDLPEIPDGVNNHKGYGIRKDELPFIDKIKPGCNWKSLEVEDQMKFMGKSFFSGGGKTGYLRKMKMDEPALTVTSTMNGKFNAQIIERGGVSRRFTVRECLRLQTVPDSFTFPDDISLEKQYERCSGIPSEFAYMLGNKIIQILDQGEKVIR